MSAGQTKEELLQYYSNLDIPTLQKLQKYSQLLIIPDEDLLTNVNMAQMVGKAHQLADSLYPEWTDRSKSDFGEFLIELFAIFSEKDFWYLNAFANEGILRKMRSYGNAFSRVSSLGYMPTVCKGASATFAVTFEAGSLTTYSRGDLVITVGSFRFTNDEDIVVPQSSSPVTLNVLLHEGTQIYEDVTFNGHNIFIKRENVSVDSIGIIIDGIAYTRVNNFGQSDSGSTHYLVLPEEDGSVSVYFGSGGYGSVPAVSTNVQTYFRTCSGPLANSGIKTASVLTDVASRSATGVVMLTEATGGLYGESLVSIKEKAPLFFYTKNAAVNETISESILKSFPSIFKAKVSVINRDVLYSIIPTSGDLEPSAEELLYIENNFYGRVITGYTPYNVPNVYQNIVKAVDPAATKLILEIIASKGSDVATMESSVRQVMTDITTPLIKADYGDSFSKNEIDILMRATSRGIQSVTFKSLIGATESIFPDFTLPATTIFSKINQSDLIVRINVV